MRREYVKWYSPSLGREMELFSAYGERGFPVVVFPTSGGRFYEYEDRGMVHAMAGKIERGELQVICVDSVDSESWYSKGASPARRLAPAKRLRRLLRVRTGSLRSTTYQLAADGPDRMQLRRISCD